MLKKKQLQKKNIEGLLTLEPNLCIRYKKNMSKSKSNWFQSVQFDVLHWEELFSGSALMTYQVPWFFFH